MNQIKRTKLATWNALRAVALLCVSGTVCAADAGKAASAPLNSVTPDTTICSVSGLDRTIPFPVGDKALYFVNIRDGDKVHSPFRVVFAVSGMGVSPVAGGQIDGTGHHHILIDLDLPPDIKAPIPFDKPDEYQHQHYKHFGKGETETVLNLPPGKHKLRLMFANHQHIPYYIASKEVNIEVLPNAK
ncbi:MAG TPA: DUF4399 domain-containing protein [Burkholderiaceae bacterium]